MALKGQMNTDQVLNKDLTNMDIKDNTLNGSDSNFATANPGVLQQGTVSTLDLRDKAVTLSKIDFQRSLSFLGSAKTSVSQNNTYADYVRFTFLGTVNVGMINRILLNVKSFSGAAVTVRWKLLNYSSGQTVVVEQSISLPGSSNAETVYSLTETDKSHLPQNEGVLQLQIRCSSTINFSLTAAQFVIQ